MTDILTDPNNIQASLLINIIGMLIVKDRDMAFEENLFNNIWMSISYLFFLKKAYKMI